MILIGNLLHLLGSFIHTYFMYEIMVNNQGHAEIQWLTYLTYGFNIIGSIVGSIGLIVLILRHLRNEKVIGSTNI